MFWFKAIILGGLAGFLLTGCSAPPERDPTTIFRYNEAAGISSLDPAFSRNQANIWAVTQIFEGLVRLDDSLRPQPALARSWQISDSGRLYSFRLRDSVLYHRDDCFESGTRTVTAADFVFSFNRLQDPDLAAPGAWVMQQVDSIWASDEQTLKLRLNNPFPPFLGLLSMAYCAVVPPEAIAMYGQDFRAHPVGTGPFRFKLWVEQEKLILRRNDHYYRRDSFGKRLPYLEAVAISFIPDKQAAFLEFVKGRLDLISGLDASYKDELLTFDGELREKYQERFKLHRQPYLNTEYLAFLVDSTKGQAVLKDQRVRQAINHCFDREKMMRYLRNNIGTPAQAGMMPKGLPAYDTARVPGYTYDPEKAARLLAEAGYPNGEGMPEIKLQTNASYLDLCEYLQGEAQKIGIPLQVEVTPPSTLRQGMATAKVPFFRASWIADYPDGENYLSLFYSANWSPEGPNYSHFANRQFDRWYERAIQITDDQERQRLYQRMDSLVMAQAPVVPLYYDQVLRFYPRKLKGLGGNPLNLLRLEKVKKINR